MTRWSLGRFAAVLLACAAGWSIVAGACLLVGSSGGGAVGWPSDRAVLAIRLETVLVASLIGAALAAAGVAYQSLLNNPLADPYLLGVSSGAMLASYLWTLPALTSFAVVFAWGQQAVAFVGAMLAVSVVLGVAGGRGRLEPVTVVLVGVIVNAVCGAAFMLVNAIVKDPARQGGALSFLVGGLQSNLLASQILAATAVTAIGLVILAAAAGRLNAGRLRDDEAEALGVRVNRLRWLGLTTASVMTASVVAISGPIGFVGLICPHAGRLLVGHDVRRLLPVAAALGAALLAVADAVARYVSSTAGIGTYLPVGIITSLLGGPFFLYLLLRRNASQP